jgi:cGMP-dependent protein kinase
MGNQNTRKLKIDNFIEYPNNLIISPVNTQIDKEACEAEKENLKLVSKHNLELKDRELLENILLEHFFLRALDNQSRKEIIKEMSLYYAKKGKTIFKQGAPSGLFYILRQGSCNLILNGKIKQVIKKNGIFGDTSLIYNTNRDYTITTLEDCFMWTIEKRNFKKILEYITHITYDDTNKSVDNLPLFKILNRGKRAKIVNDLYRETHLPGRPIYYPGQISNCIYIVKDGVVNIKDDKKVVKIFKEGDFFGDMSVIGLTNRFMTAEAKEKTHLYSISVSNLEKIFGENFRTHYILSLIKIAFFKTEDFKNINFDFLDEIVQFFKFRFYNKQTEILRPGDSKSNRIIIPINGELYDSDGDKLICAKNSMLFDKEIYNEDKTELKSSIYCSSLCLIARAKTSDIQKKYKCSLKDLIEQSSKVEQLKNVALFKNLTKEKFDLLATKIKTEKIPDRHNVITQGEEGTRFYIIKKGFINIYVNKKYIRTMNENEYLGERALFFKEPRSATATAKGDAEVYYLDKEDFETVIEKNLKDYLIDRIYLQDDSITLDQLTYLATLGAGSYGNVSLVKSAKKNYFYAIKNISNKQILYNQLCSNLELEKGILLQIDHPFIVKLVKTLKDEKFIYFLMDYIRGKELFDVIRDIGVLTKSQTLFYGASIMLAVRYLHQRKFVYRDIKPENIMVLENGYIKIIDFGTAKAIEDKTKTTMGTPHYMAPEMILGTGYSFEVDYWAIACCMYEFICGGVPFADDSEDTMEIYIAIKNE